MLDLSLPHTPSALSVLSPFALPDLELSSAPPPLAPQALRARAVAAARTLLLSEGHEGVQLAAVARLAALAPGLLQLEFPQRELLLRELLRPMLHEQQTLMRGWALLASRAQGGQLAGHVHTLLLCQWDVLRTHAGGPALLLALARLPGLQALRQESVEAAAQLLALGCARAPQGRGTDLSARLAAGALETALLLLCEQSSLDASALAHAVARMLSALWEPGPDGPQSRALSAQALV